MPHEFHYRWEWYFQAPPEALWPLVADTNRFDRDTGLPSTHRVEAPPTQAGFTQNLGFKIMGFPIEWEEEPFEWIKNRYFSVIRTYAKGPTALLKVHVEFFRREEGGTRLVYQVWAQPAGILGYLAIPVKIGVLSYRAFTRQLKAYDKLALLPTSQQQTESYFYLEPGGEQRLNMLAAQLFDITGSSWVENLQELIRQGDSMSLCHLSPYALADHWDANRRDILELCLHATQLGMLDMNWNLLCPLCRGAKSVQPSLRDISSSVHCNSCRIDYTVNFDQSVEVTFRPNPSIRKIKDEVFCAGAPQLTPHIQCQQLLNPGEERKIQINLQAKTHRLRTANGDRSILIESKALTGTYILTAQGWQHLPSANTISDSSEQQFSLKLENQTEERHLIILEQAEWSNQYTTAAQVTSLQKFRDLFASEALRPHEQISVGSITIAFTDLRDSTALYQRIGDAPAFGSVMTHFDILQQVIQEEEGAIVKTMGDAVMAVFCRPVSAVRAMVKAQRILSSSQIQGQTFHLKAGLHCGPCITVNLNDRLDYFGSTVNMAARLQRLSQGNDLVISNELYTQPDVSHWLNISSQALHIQSIHHQLKGFDDINFNLWRIQPNILIEPSRASASTQPDTDI